MSSAFQHAVDLIPDPAAIRATDGTVLAVNRAFRAIVPVAVGGSMVAVLPDGAARRFARADARTPDSGAIVRFSVFLRQDEPRRTRAFEVRQWQRVVDGRPVIVSTLRDTDRLEAAEIRLDQMRRSDEQAIAIIGEFVSRSTRDVTEGVGRIVATLGETSGAASIWYFDYDRRSHVLYLGHGWRGGAVVDDPPELAVQTVGARWWERIVDDRRCQLRDRADRAPFASIIDPDDVCDLYAVYTDRETVGALLVERPDSALLGAGSGHLFRIASLMFANVVVRQEIEQLLNRYSIELERQVQERTHDLNIAYETLKRTQTQLLQAGKMASVGQLAAGVAHEINNPIGFVKSNLRSLEDAFRAMRPHLDHVDDEVIRDVDELLSESADGLRRVEEIVAGLRTFSREERAEQRMANVNEILERTLRFVEPELRHTAEVKTDFAEVPAIPCYPDRLMQVFVNLLVNAAHAIPERGTIRVATRASADSVIVSVADDGVGIPDDVLDRIFEPFFTTKDVGEGTGLGLALAYETVSSHGGQIHVESEAGSGTEFTVTLPLDDRARRAQELSDQIAREYGL